MNQNINIDLNKVDNIKCDECSGETFVPVFVIKHLSALMSPTGQETMVPIQLFKCSACDHVNEKFLEGLTN
jgi:NAD-dependent dihydropyrimidine dehydrogenase PreA subunit